jgi:dolichyl-phosphate-mannose-protein mannosyltransferase
MPEPAGGLVAHNRPHRMLPLPRTTSDLEATSEHAPALTQSTPRTDLRASTFDPSSLQAIAVGSALLLPSLVWVLRDRSVWPWDPAWYGQISIDLWSTLTLHPSEWPNAMSHAFGIKPPAIAWLGQLFVPLGYRLHAVEPALLIGVVACQAATVALVYGSARRLGGGKAVACMAATLVASAPLFTAMSQAYFAEPIQMLAVAWLLFVMASAERWPFPLVVAQVVAASSLGMLSKLSSPLFMAAPALCSLLVAVRQRRRHNRRRRWRDARVVSAIIVAMALLFGAVVWYSKNVHAAIEHARTVDSPLWGQPRPYLVQLGFWTHALDRALLLPGLEAVVVAIVLSWATIFRDRGVRRLSSHQALSFAACVLTILFTLAVVSRQVARDVRYISPLLPIAGVGLAILASHIRTRAVQTALLAAVAFQFAVVTSDSFGGPVPKALHYDRIRVDSNDPFAEALRKLAASTCNPQTSGRLSIVGVDYAWLNANSLTLLAHERFSRSGIDCYYTALGLAEQDAAAAWRRVRSFEPPYYIGVDYGNARNPLPVAQRTLVAPSDPFNVVNRAVLRQALNSGRFEIVQGTQHAGLILLRWNAGN